MDQTGISLLYSLLTGYDIAVAAQQVMIGSRRYLEKLGGEMIFCSESLDLCALDAHMAADMPARCWLRPAISSSEGWSS